MTTTTISQEQKIQSLQHSVLFLQQQHASTLAGLHQEIERLQQKCTALTFQLTHYHVSPVEAQQDTGSSLQETFENEIRTLRLENKQLKSTCDTKDKRILLLEGQLKSKEKKFNDDLKNVQRSIAELQLELENKGSTIAYLTTQLHQSKLKNKSQVHKGEEAEGTHVGFSPTPPGGSPTRRHERNLRRTATSPAANVSGLIQESTSHQLVASDYVLQNSLPKSSSNRFSTRYKQSVNDPLRPAVGHSQAKRDRELRRATRPKPSGYEDFIRISQSNEVISKSSIEPLPPITTRSGRQMRDPVRTTSRVLRSNRATASSSGEVETIIVEKTLTSPDRAYRKLQNSSSK